MSVETSSDPRPVCLVCGFRSHSILGHLRAQHGMSAEEYLEKHPGAPTLSQQLFAEMSKSPKRVAAPLATELTVEMMGFEVKVDAAVAEQACLKRDDHFAFPSKGKAKLVYERVLMALIAGRDAFVWGPAGTGKDAIVHAYSSLTRRPTVLVSFVPGTDLGPMFYSRKIDVNGTGWEFGALYDALVNGIKGRDGVARPIILLLSDIDRADTSQAEWFRLLADTTQKRVKGPTGVIQPVMAGTQIICTANSCGTGDSGGRMASAGVMDASILDRLGRKIQAEYMDWDDEGRILSSKFPALAARCPDIFFTQDKSPGQLGQVIGTLRDAIGRGNLFAEFTMRGSMEVLSECEDILKFKYPKGGAPANILKLGMRAWLDGLEPETRFEALRLIDAHLKGGALD